MPMNWSGSKRRAIREVGFAIVSEVQPAEPDPAVPRLTIEITGVGDDRVADAIACTIALTIEQHATIQRLGKTLCLPTFTRHATALVPKVEVRTTLRQATSYLVDQFVNWRQLATTAQ